MIFRPVTLAFDGECRFCIRSLRIVKFFDVLERITLVDANDPATVRTYPAFRGSDFSNAMYATDGCTVFVGFYAFRRAFFASPLLAPLACLWYIPGVAFVGERVYRWVAAHRRGLGCKLL
jgi:predicted DCC family thiol-disulfide oxidoreductase YuxK